MDLSVIKKYVSAYFGLLFLLSGILGGVFLVTSSGSFDTRSKAAGASVVLSFGTAPANPTVGTQFSLPVSIGNNVDQYPVSATAVTVNWSPASALRLDEVVPNDYFLMPSNTTATEMLKLGITCTTNTDCRPEITDPSNISTTIQCTGTPKFCKNVTTNVPPLGVAGTHTFYLGARCPTAIPPTTGCLLPSAATGFSGILATLKFTPLASGAVTISFDSNTDKTAVAATTQTTNLVSSSSFASPLNLTVSGGTGTTADLMFKVKFDGVNTQKTRPTAIVYEIKSGVAGIKNGTANISADASAVYAGTITGITPGVNYDVFLKESTHLKKKFSGVTLNAGANPKDWSGTVLLGGDANMDNLVSMADFVYLAQDYKNASTQGSSPADFNYDSLVNMADFTILAQNYKLKGD